MACTGAYAQSWEYAVELCVKPLAYGLDDSGGAANAFLTASTQDFLKLGFRANEGMILYNLTQSTDGPITNVTATTMTATGVTWDDVDIYRAVPLDREELALTDRILTMAASNIHAALGAVGACDCTKASWAAEYLAKINVLEAAAMHMCPCGRPDISEEQRAKWLVEVNDQLFLIRSGEIEVCAGHTGSLYPAGGFFQQTVTDFALADAIRRRLINERS